jgi:hypothetical protein
MLPDLALDDIENRNLVLEPSGVSGLDALVCFLVGAACIYAAFRTWPDQHRYG